MAWRPRVTNVDRGDGVKHRGGIRARLRPEQDLFARIGGRETIERIVDGLYDRIEHDPSLRPMFVRNLAGEREKQKDFFQEWLGGAPDYTHHHAYSGMQQRHSHIYITRGAALTWIGYLTEALTAAVADASLVDEVIDIARPIALSFVNETSPPASSRELRCRRLQPFRSIRALAAKGDATALRRELQGAPALAADAIEMAQVMLKASVRGQTQVVEVLLDAGADPNRPAHFKEGCIFQSLMLTPLCGALVKGHADTAEALTSSGAVYDVFTACYLGDLERVREFVEKEPTIVHEEDPSSDLLQITPLYHAVHGGHLAVVELLFERGSVVGRNSTAMVRQTANRGNLPMVERLLAQGADATRIGAGRWVLHAGIAALLMANGVVVNYPEGEWIWRSCTGNNSQRDDATYVEALLDHGADVETRHRGATALHYAAKAGFLHTARLLLDRGADPNAPNGENETPLFYAFKAGKRSDIAAMVGVLVAGGADPSYADPKGMTPARIAKRMRRPDQAKIVAALES